MPVNYMLIETLMKFHHYLGDSFKIAVPCMDNRQMTLQEVSCLLVDRITAIYSHGIGGQTPAFPPGNPHHSDPHWRNLLFHEYYHGETGQGLGAAHQTGWTGLVANLLLMKHNKGD
jgi:hypothetical protein